MIMTMSSIGLPTLNGFIGEFLILQGVFRANLWWAVVAGSGVVLGAAYMLWLYQRTMFGKIENPKNENLLDMNLREVATFVPLIILAVWIGIYPSPFLRILEPTVNNVIARLNPAYATRTTAANAGAEAAKAADAAKGAEAALVTDAAKTEAKAKADKDCADNKPTTPFTTAPCGPDEATKPAEASPKPKAEAGAKAKGQH